MVKVSGQVYPNQSHHEIYRFYYDKYVRSYFALRDLMHEVSSKEGGKHISL
ncbi:MAG: hypothetical protein J7J32_00045 [Candidatus Atribacteria bacterium]|nr:hypothetical protein [Candidatus Atribacteria bacterium]MCD6350028.1 hypothetical protein [Candidatus Atribacteria bacterium]